MEEVGGDGEWQWRVKKGSWMQFSNESGGWSEA